MIARKFVATLALVAVAALAGCSDDDSKPTPSGTSSPSSSSTPTPSSTYTEPGGGEATAGPGTQTPAPSVTAGPDMDSSFLKGSRMNAERARFTLEALPVAQPGSMDGYTSTVFRPGPNAEQAGWPVQNLPSARCDVAAATLIRDAEEFKVDTRCAVTSGSWTDPFTDKRHTAPSSMRPVYVVPSEEVWRSGGSKWDKEQVAIYSSSSVSLVAATETAATERGSNGPAQWRPSYDGGLCPYAMRWIEVKNEFGLSLTSESERVALRLMLSACTTPTNA